MDRPCSVGRALQGATLLFFLLSILSVLKYHSFHATLFDLGIYQNHLYNVAHGVWERAFFGHVQPIMFLWALFYRLLSPEIAPYWILVAQAAALSLPVYLLLRQGERWSALAYALYFPVWYNALFDFHFDHLAIPILFFYYHWQQKGRPTVAVGMALLPLLLKEPFALQTIFFGLHLAWIGKRPWHGLFLMLVGAGYFYTATMLLIPLFTMGEQSGISYSAFSWMGNSISGMLLFLVTHPVTVALELFGQWEKLLYVGALLGSLGFIPLLRPAALIPTLPFFGISLLSRDLSYSALGHHYTAGLVAPLIVAFGHGLPVARTLWTRFISHSKNAERHFALWLAIGLFTTHIVLAPSIIGRLFWSPAIWSYNKTAYQPTQRDERMRTALQRYIPEQANLVSAQNTVLNGLLCHRLYCASFPTGVTKLAFISGKSTLSFPETFLALIDHKEWHTQRLKLWADYVVLDLQRPWFMDGIGCGWKQGVCQDQAMSDEFLAALEFTKTQYSLLHEDDGFMIFARKPQTLDMAEHPANPPVLP